MVSVVETTETAEDRAITELFSQIKTELSVRSCVTIGYGEAQPLGPPDTVPGAIMCPQCDLGS